MPTLLLVEKKDPDAIAKGRSQPPWDFLKEKLEAGSGGEDLTLQHNAAPMFHSSKRAGKKNKLGQYLNHLKIESVELHVNKKSY